MVPTGPFFQLYTSFQPLFSAVFPPLFHPVFFPSPFSVSLHTLPMALTPQDIARVANLARLELRPDETERTLSQLNGFFALVEQMDAVNTEGVEPLAHP